MKVYTQEIFHVTRFDENTDLSTTYWGKRGQTRKSVIRAEECFPISGRGYSVRKLANKTDCNILIDTDGQYVAVLFVIPVIIEIHGHLFEVFTLVSEIHDNVDLVLGNENAYELEGIVDT